MATLTRPRGRIRAAMFEVDLDFRALYKNGLRVPLQDKAFLVLAIPLGRSGEVVTREELPSSRWQADSFGAFEDACFRIGVGS